MTRTRAMRMSFRRTMIIASASAALVAGGSFAQADSTAGINSGWSATTTLWSTGATPGPDVAVATPPSFEGGLLISAGRISKRPARTWTGGSRIPEAGTEMHRPWIDMANPRRALATWAGAADTLTRAIWDRGRWIRDQYGVGVGEGRLDVTGDFAATAWYEVPTATGQAEAMYVSTWDGSWSERQDLALPGAGLPQVGSPRIAVFPPDLDAEGRPEATVAWSQNGELQIAFRRFGVWQMPSATGPGRSPLAATPLSSAEQTDTILVTGRVVATGVELESWTASPEGGVIGPTSLGIVPAVSADTVDVDLTGDGRGMAVFATASGKGAAAWKPGKPLTTVELGNVHADATIASDAYRVATTPFDSTGPVTVHRWSGGVWKPAQRIGTCRGGGDVGIDGHSGTTVVWACSDVHLRSSPPAPGRVPGLRVKVSGTKAIVRWDRIPHAESTLYKVIAPDTHRGWRDAPRRRAWVPLRSSASYVVAVRGINSAFRGPISRIQVPAR